MACAPVRSMIPSLKLGDYLSVQAHNPCSISHKEHSDLRCKRELGAHRTLGTGSERRSPALFSFPDSKKVERQQSEHVRFNPLKRQTKLAAYDILIFYFYLSKKIRPVFFIFHVNPLPARGFT